MARVCEVDRMIGFLRAAHSSKSHSDCLTTLTQRNKLEDGELRTCSVHYWITAER